MAFFDKLEKYLTCFLQVFCLPVYMLLVSEYQDKRFLKNIIGFVAGFCLGQLYYYYLLKDLPFWYDLGFIVSLIISICLGISNAVLIQVRCVLILLLPMYCGKPGRGVLKAIVLTYVVAGPITNMGLNAEEVVRVFACSEQLSYNLSKIKYNQMYHPIHKALLRFKQDVNDMKITMNIDKKTCTMGRLNATKQSLPVNPAFSSSQPSMLYYSTQHSLPANPAFTTSQPCNHYQLTQHSLPVNPAFSTSQPSILYQSTQHSLPVNPAFFTSQPSILYQSTQHSLPVNPAFSTSQPSILYQSTQHSLPVNPAFSTSQPIIAYVANLPTVCSSIREVISPIEYEIEGITNLDLMKAEIQHTNSLFKSHHKIDKEKKISFNQKTEIERNQAKYIKKMYYRCENHLNHAISTCLRKFSSAYNICMENSPPSAGALCSPLMLPGVCDVRRLLKEICASKKQIDTGLGEGYTTLKRAKQNVTNNIDKINLQTKIVNVRKLYDVQDAKETGDRVIHAFKEKYFVMKSVINIVNFCLALLFLRIVIAAQTYHDLYLTFIDFDNVYITEYFKNIDKKRAKKSKFFLLPLNKMERNRYIDVHSATYIPAERSNLLTQILKVMLEAITATTFVMLDRLFFEALDVVRQHAMETEASNLEDIQIEIEGKGVMSNMMRKILKELSSNKTIKMISKETCFPHPRAMPTFYYVKIYGGYLWILLLLYINPYTLRLRRLICSYFYPLHEKQRILHLYNDILKKRMKMQKTLRRKAVQAVRAHYLAGENLLSLRIRYPNLLGWLSAFPAARMKCLICEETEPRKTNQKQCLWQSCRNPRCPFVLCAECSAGGRGCLACDPALALLSDVDSLSDDPPQRY